MQGPMLSSASACFMRQEQRARWLTTLFVALVMTATSAAQSCSTTLVSTSQCGADVFPSTAGANNTCAVCVRASMLNVVQMSDVFDGSKTFVDLPLLSTAEQLASDYATLTEELPQCLPPAIANAPGTTADAPPDSSCPDTNAAQLDASSSPICQAAVRQFVESNFAPSPEADMEPWLPDDTPTEAERAKLLAGVNDAKLREFGSTVMGLWEVLGRRINPAVAAESSQHTLLPLTNPTIIVAGGRFREVYYWDSYWIVRGLLASNMTDTARRVAENMLGLVDKYGFMPNGNRCYYTTRSQPPMLTQVVSAVFERTQDVEWLKKALPLLRAEYDYWTHPEYAPPAPPTGARHAKCQPDAAPSEWPGRGHSVRVPLDTSSGWPWHFLFRRDVTLLRYVFNAGLGDSTVRATPRPESFSEDIRTVYGEGAGASNNSVNASKANQLFGDIRAAAESGWDFSSRWMERASGDTSNNWPLSSLATSSVVPVELNSIMCRNEYTLAKLHARAGQRLYSYRFEIARRKRRDAIQQRLFDSGRARWLDLSLNTLSAHRPEEKRASDFVPLWASSCLAGAHLNWSAVVEALANSSELIGVGGVAVTSVESGQQWDKPNVWPPVTHMLIEGLEQVAESENLPAAHKLAMELAQTYISSAYILFNQTGVMFEKFNSTRQGRPGGGGEYATQVGFGWTNGVTLLLLQAFGGQLRAPEQLLQLLGSGRLRRLQESPGPIG